MEGKKSNTELIIGISIAAVLVVIIVVAVSGPSTPTYPVGYNPNLYPAGYNPVTNPNAFYGQPNDKAALYTAGASVINKTLDTFFSSNDDQNS